MFKNEFEKVTEANSKQQKLYDKLTVAEDKMLTWVKDHAYITDVDELQELSNKYFQLLEKIIDNY